MYISSLMEFSNKEETLGFVLLRCVPHKSGGVEENKGKEEEEEDNSKGLEEDPNNYIQILPLPPRRLARSSSQTIEEEEERLSFNILVLGESSREEFFLAYQQTILELNKINRDHLTQAEILDFQMVQSLGHDNEVNLKAMLAGYVDLRDEGGVSDDHLLHHAASQGYRTSVYQGGCLQHSPLSMVLRQNITDTNLQERLRKDGIHETGSSFAFCPLTSPACWNPPCSIPALPCFNPPCARRTPSTCCTTLSQVEANLESLWMNLKHIEQHRVLHFSIFFLDNRALNNQVVDNILVRFVDDSLALKNTFTVITSTKSSSYQESLPLILIVPGKSKGLLEDTAWQSLVVNQDRLISHLDLYQTIRFLMQSKLSPGEEERSSQEKPILDFRRKYVGQPEGLLKERLVSRHCNELPRTEFGCLCLPETQEVKVDQRIKLIGLFGCEMFQDGKLCGCTSLTAVSTHLHTYPGSSMLEHIGTVELENGRGIRTIVDVSVNTATRRIQILPVASNLDCNGETSKEEDILDHIDEKIVHPGVKKTVESVYMENGVNCMFLIELSSPGVAVVQLVNTCNSQIEIKLDFRSETAYFLHLGEVVRVVGSGKLEPVNLFLETSPVLPAWQYSVQDTSSM